MNRSGRTTRDRAGRPADTSPARERDRRRPGLPAAVAGGRRSGDPARRTTGPVTALPPPQRRPTWSRRRRVLVWLVALAVVAGLVAFLWAGPLLAVRTVRVDGVDTLPAAQVQEAAGVVDGTPLLQVEVGAAAARVARLPQVADVQVTRGWPSTVIITVVERTPLAVVEEAGRRTLIDAEGVLFDTITGDPPKGVVRMEVAHPGPDDPATASALAAVAALPPELREKVSVVTARDGGAAVGLSLHDGRTVRWGDGEDSERKATVLVALLSQMDAGEIRPAETLDVSAPGAVVLR
jgi:cell division protein FtsQ